MSFTVGETVVYPNHGAAVIEAIEMRTIKGEERQYLVRKRAPAAVRHQAACRRMACTMYSSLRGRFPCDCMRLTGEGFQPSSDSIAIVYFCPLG